MTETEFDLESLPIAITYVGETVRDKDWKCDQWRVALTGKAGYWSTDYFTGTGLRAKPDAWGKRKPKKPSIADVLQCLFNEAQAAEYNFSDWCSDFGYSDDSIKALNTYKACLDTATAIRKYFTYEQRAAIEALISEM